MSEAGTIRKEHVSWNTSARDAYLAPLNTQKLQFQGAIKNMQETIDLKSKENTDAKLRLSENYASREDILVGRQDLILEYQNKKASLVQAKHIVEVLKALNTLVDIAASESLQSESVALLNRFMEAKKEDRVSISKDLERLIQSEIDPDQKEVLLSLKKTLEYYDLTLQNSEEREAGKLISSAFEQLLSFATSETRTLNEVSDLLKTTQEDFEDKVDASTLALAKIKSLANNDFEALEEFNLKITAENKLVQENKSYIEILKIEIKKCDEALVELEKKIALAPPAVKVVTYSYEYNDVGRGNL